VPGVDRAALQAEITAVLLARHAAPEYEATCAELGWPVDAVAAAAARATAAARLAELDAALADAEERAGEVEVRDALTARARHLADTGERAEAAAAYAAAAAKTAGAGPKLDLEMDLLRADLARGDLRAAKAGLARAAALVAAGGDWERKNRLRVYEALFAAATRDFPRAAALLLDAVATFTATELMSYERCVFYTVALAAVALDRPTLKARVVDSPEVLAAVDAVPHLHAFVDSLYEARYADYFQALAGLSDALRSDRFLHPHFRFFLREARGVAYAQFLAPYRSVTLPAMAAAFGVSPAFMDGEVAEFVAAGRLAARVDRVAGVVEATRPDAKAALYEAAIRQGDALLNRLQRLGKAADVA
jgi:26S proteasome regulatory subunit N7